MIRVLFILMVTICPFTGTLAQTSLNAEKIYGKWNLCWRKYAFSSRNADSLKGLQCNCYDSGNTWVFYPDGTEQRIFPGRQEDKKLPFRLEEKDGQLSIVIRKRRTNHILHLDDSCLIVWHINPKTATTEIYRR